YCRISLRKTPAPLPAPRRASSTGPIPRPPGARGRAVRRAARPRRGRCASPADRRLGYGSAFGARAPRLLGDLRGPLPGSLHDPNLAALLLSTRRQPLLARGFGLVDRGRIGKPEALRFGYTRVSSLGRSRCRPGPHTRFARRKIRYVGKFGEFRGGSPADRLSSPCSLGRATRWPAPGRIALPAAR